MNVWKARTDIRSHTLYGCTMAPVQNTTQSFLPLMVEKFLFFGMI